MEHIITHCNTRGVNQDTVPQDIRQETDGTARHTSSRKYRYTYVVSKVEVIYAVHVHCQILITHSAPTHWPINGTACGRVEGEYMAENVHYRL